MRLSSFALFSTLLFALGRANAKAYLQETFGAGWDKKWKQSDWKKSSGEAGEWKWTAGDWYGDAESDKGIQTTPDARFHTLYAPLDSEFKNEGKDLVLQYQVKNTQKLDCGGGYIKLVPSSVSDKDMKSFSGDTAYSIMFGPDVCGSTRRVHVIFNYKGTNHLIKRSIYPETDQLSHVYTLIVHSNNTYKVLVDNKERAQGSLYEDWDMLLPRKIKDPEAKKPEDWDDRPMIPDPEDKKPEGYDDIPAEIPDADAKKPEDWDDAEDGEWVAPQVPNPEYKGEWRPKMISNPDYKGQWEAPEIANPDFKDDPKLYVQPPLKYVAFELWQVKSGTIFDNILVTDSVQEAHDFAEATWGKSKEAEKKAFEAHEEAERAANPKGDDEAGGFGDGGFGGMAGMEGMEGMGGDFDEPEDDLDDGLGEHDEL